MYADDSKVINELKEGPDSSLQEDINEINGWCKKWSMSLNSSKCKIMHFGKQNPRRKYYIEGKVGRVWLETTEVEKDLGVMISSDGRNNKQVESAVSKANRALGRMRKTFKYFNIQLFKVLYPAFVRTHLEFASAVWNSMTRREINRLEGIQKRATKMVIELRGLVYEDRLKELGITSQEMEKRTDFRCTGEGIIIKEDIQKRLESLNCEKAPGGDGVAQRVLKNCPVILAGVMEAIFNKTMEEGKVPSEWRDANISPLFKKGSKLEASNYRPVSLTSVCCKVMEGIVRDSIASHLNRHNLISARQHGFVQQRACVTNLLECQHEISVSLGKNKSIDVLYTDFEKAFDKVSHRKLIVKLEAYGIGGKLLVD